ncbi:dTDP-4-amino-4,6-dideoxy-D-glucose acetyltransferase VioB, partial [Escherichia coli]|nr:dTDP-4-amino-4,6-dideoxy-D-glucose acetyltransferase VioB [Escherichia coli]
MAYLDEIQLKEMGFKSVGENVKISDKASFYGCDNISIGNNVRIDDFCVFSAGEGGID